MKQLITFLLLFSTLFIISQTKISKKDKETYTFFLEELQNGNVKKGIKLADSTYAIAIKEDNKVLEVLMLNILAYGNVKKGNFNESNKFYNKEYTKIINFNKSNLRDSLLLQNLNEHGDHYLNNGNFSKSIKKFHKALIIAKKNKDSVTISTSYNLLGNAYAMQELYDDAIFYYTECAKYNTSKKVKNIIDNNLGNIYSEKKEFKLAEKHLLATLKTNDSTNFYDLSTSYLNLADLYSDMKNYKKAHRLFLKADEYASQLNDKLYILESKISLISSFTNIKDYESAKRYIKICESLVNEVDSNLLKLSLYVRIYESSAKMKDYKTAFKNVEKYMALEDSLFNIETTKIIKDLKIKHESELKETEIIAQKELINFEKNKNTALLIGLTLILTSIVFLYNLHKKRIYAQKKLLKKQKELAFEKMNTVLEKQKVKTFQSHIEGQNKERERIAKDLHDSISGNLAAIKMRLSNLKTSDSKELNAAILNLDATYNEVRTISHNLLPQKIKNQNFTENVNQLVILYQSKNLKIDVDIFPEEEINKLPKNIEVELYRILQELITNIIKHAKATKCLINITIHNNYLNIIVEDNGVGYKINKKNKGIGLNNISSRLDSINGSLDIDTAKEKGTIVNINIPTN